MYVQRRWTEIFFNSISIYHKGYSYFPLRISHYHLIQFLVSYYYLMQTRLFVPVEAETKHIACLQMVIVEIFAEL